MKPLESPYRPAVAGALVGLALAALPLAAQTDVRVVAPTIKDARSRYGTNDPSGSLTLFTKVEGAGIEGAKGFRITVTGAKDEAGNSLLPESPEKQDWADSPSWPGLWIKLKSPNREASTVTVTGTLEVYLPSRDPAAEVKVEKFYAKAGKPIVSTGLKDAKIELTVVPRERVNEGSVVLVGRTPDMERIRSIRVVKADGTELPTAGRSSQSDSESTMLQIGHSEAVPPDAGLVFTLLTEKSILAVPFELKDVPLP